MIRQFLRLFYDFNKYAMNLYWIFYVKAVWKGASVKSFAFWMFIASLLYLISGIVYYIPRKKFPVPNKNG